MSLLPFFICYLFIIGVKLTGHQQADAYSMPLKHTFFRNINEKESRVANENSYEVKSGCAEQTISRMEENMSQMQQGLEILREYVASTKECDKKTANGNSDVKAEPKISNVNNGTSSEYDQLNNTICRVYEEISPETSSLYEDAQLQAWQRQIDLCKELLEESRLVSSADQMDTLNSPIKRRTIKIKRKQLQNQNQKRNGEAWAPWTNWSPCSVSCGSGKQIRYRKCVGENCQVDIEMDEKQCLRPSCDPDLYKILRIF